MPNLSHIWQRFLLTSSFFVGLAIGVVAAVFGYSNLQSVDVHLGAFHIDAIPLWTVAVVPLAVTLAAGALYHWVDGLHHFTEHMRHRHRVHELEAELATLRAHLDQVLEMPDHGSLPAKAASKGLPSQDAEPAEPAPLETTSPAAAPAPTSESTPRKSERRKRARLIGALEPGAAQPNGEKAFAESTEVADKTAEPAGLPQPPEPAATAPGA